jgi:serine/threonine protein kinase
MDLMQDSLTPDGQFGRFHIEAEVGRGGMGIVYRCYDPEQQQAVALKILAAHLLSDTNALTRFRREADLIAQLHHPSIADFYEFGEEEQRPYIALEWIEGDTLKQILANQGHLPLSECLNMLAQLADALDYAHKHGVIHRDLKPANIVIDKNGQATIVDFGMALLESAPSITSTNLVVGTPLFMSPEQILGKPLDGRSDQYCLAVILYEILTGQPPFEPQTTAVAVYNQQINVMPPLATTINPTLPASVAAALNRALAKDPDQRFGSMLEFSQAMHASEVDFAATVASPPARKRTRAGLRSNEPSEKAKTWLLDKEVFVIGRYPPADLVILKDRISRQHAQIRYHDFSYYVTDLGSRNGTFVNGRPLDQTPARLSDGDEIVFGGAASFRFFDPEETTHGPRLGRLQGIWIDEKLSTVWIDAHLVDPPLSPAQYTLLSLLYTHDGQIVSREAIITAVYPEAEPEGISNEAIDGLIKRLRQRLRQANSHQEYIEVVRGHGLRLTQPQ